MMKFKYEEIELLKTKIAVAVQIPREQLEWGEFGTRELEEEFVAQLNLYLYGQEKAHTCVLEYETYETWLDHLIDTKFPCWLKKYFKINFKHQEKRERLVFDVLFPELQIATTQPRVVIRKIESR